MPFRPLLCIRIDDETELRIDEERHAREFAELVDQNRAYLRKRLPMEDDSRTVEDSRAFIRSSLQQFAKMKDSRRESGIETNLWWHWLSSD